MQALRCENRQAEGREVEQASKPDDKRRIKIYASKVDAGGMQKRSYKSEKGFGTLGMQTIFLFDTQFKFIIIFKPQKIPFIINMGQDFSKYE